MLELQRFHNALACCNQWAATSAVDYLIVGRTGLTVRLLGRRQTFPSARATLGTAVPEMLQRIHSAPCPSCHSDFVECLEMSEPVVSGIFWRCNMCGHVWKGSDRAATHPRF